MTAPHRRVRGVADVDGVPDGVVAGGDERVVDELLLRDFAGGEGGGELPEPGLKLSVTAGHAGLLSDSPSAAFASAAWRAFRPNSSRHPRAATRASRGQGLS